MDWMRKGHFGGVRIENGWGRQVEVEDEIEFSMVWGRKV